MRRLLIAMSLLLCALAATAPVPAADSSTRPRVTNLQVERAGDKLLVSYSLEDVVTEEMTENIAAGIPLRFRHRVEVTTRHWLPLWPRGTVASATVETTLVYDSLTHLYGLSRVIEASSRGKGKSQPETQEASTVLESEARAWMTQVQEFPLLDLSTLPADVTARVRVESALGRKWIVLVPTRRIVAADQKLEPTR